MKSTLFNKYENIHPLIVHRTMDYLKNEEKIIQALESLPKKYPIFWDEENKKWINKKCHN